MTETRIARTPQPPYYAVIFTSRYTDADTEGYGRMAEKIGELARAQPGYLGFESARDAAGIGISVSYWESEEAIRNWKGLAEHLIAQRTGRERWYVDYTVRVAKVERAYTLDSSAKVGLER